MSVVDEVKSRLDVVEIISETVKLRKTGKNYSGFCPFHPNSRTPAFAVFPDSGTWKCYGACNEGGDVFRFVMKRDGLTFPEALQTLATRAGVELRPRTPQDVQAEETHARLRGLLDLSATYYRHLLLHAPQAEPARQLLAARGLGADVLEVFQVGYALSSWDAGLDHFREKGYSDDEIVQAGLASQRDDGRIHDRFRNRILFPIRDASGRMTGFGARVVDSHDQPKFLNSPQSPLFDKGGNLYGLDRARRAIREQDQVVIVEGYLDVVAAHQAGFSNVVASMGTALTETQLRILKKFTRRMLLALDADAAGSQATLRGLEVARASLDHEADPVFNARGLVRHESRLQADIRVLRLPEGQDPDDIVRADPQHWRTLVAEAEPVVQYVIGVLTAGRNLDDPKVKAEIAQRVLPLIRDVADPVEREAYRQRLARVLKVSERALEADAGPRPRPARPSSAETEPPPASARPSRGLTTELEQYCLAVLTRMPGFVGRVDKYLREVQLDPLQGEDFVDAERREIFETLRRLLDEDGLESADGLRGRLDPLLAERLSELEELAERLDVSDVPSAVALLMSRLLTLRERRIRRRLEELEFLSQQAESDGDADATRAYRDASAAQSAGLGRLDRAMRARVGVTGAVKTLGAQSGIR